MFQSTQPTTPHLPCPPPQTPPLSTLSLHGAHPIYHAKTLPKSMQHWIRLYEQLGPEWLPHVIDAGDLENPPEWVTRARSEEHTSELRHPSISYAVFCLKKKTNLTSMKDQEHSSNAV